MNATVSTVLVVEDEPKLGTLLHDYLQASGYGVVLLEDGAEAVERVRHDPPAAVLLDLMLPGKDGMSVCREIRAFSNVPIIMTTARVEEIDRLLGLELGADDYICKPYSPREVVARVRAVLRRARDQSGAGPDGGPDGGPLRLDEARLKVRAGGREIDLTAVEFALLATLHAQPGRIFSRDVLMDRIYRDHRVVSDRTIDSHIKKLRRRLAELLPERELIHSVYGVGYRYES